MDLASLTNSEVRAANNGRVIFADSFGIYGLTIVIDHGQGLASTYSHLSKKTIEVGQRLQFRHYRPIFVPGRGRLVPKPSSGINVRGIVDGNAGNYWCEWFVWRKDRFGDNRSL